MTSKKNTLPRAPPASKILLSVREAAAVLDLSESSVRNLIRDGKLRAVVPGSGTGHRACRKIPRSELDTYSALLMATSAVTP